MGSIQNLANLSSWAEELELELLEILLVCASNFVGMRLIPSGDEEVCPLVSFNYQYVKLGQQKDLNITEDDGDLGHGRYQ